MSDPFLGEIRMFAGTTILRGWARCDGSLLSIASNSALFSLLGVDYGGDGIRTFALPDLRGRIPVHQGQWPNIVGKSAGAENVTLLPTQLPAHSHQMLGARVAGTSTSAQGNVLAGWADSPYGAPATGTALAVDSVESAGGTQPHENMPPYVVLNFYIATNGVFPSRS
jgi:microcystin-dependent protein